ncbi:hypothetical protein EHQ81_04460 [Leptospira selangorensis]|uniref:Uncharacterized protein n=1 Tax=Leptospira selangorensis TaxID=2484982 RepID=A0A5F2C015_9LEPT|nr:hypothetical protein [Leptospira selangorensis]TGM15651.1 hypothetical protein EHQ81_04460 [Leptospira selangorensis]TGM18399.1 hypothetical protein EHQ82_15245 [Leptospira selangorensis]
MKTNVHILMIFLAFFQLISCSKSPQEKVKTILSDAQLNEEEKIKMAAFALFGERLKEIDLVKVQDEKGAKFEVYLGFGGTSALTFLGSEKYSDHMKLELALGAYKFLQSLQGFRFGKYRMSLIKPFFIKNGEARGAEEFEIYRFRAEGEDLKNVAGFKETDAFSSDNYDVPSEKVVTVLKNMIDHWQVELDQFARVEIK